MSTTDTRPVIIVIEGPDGYWRDSLRGGEV